MFGMGFTEILLILVIAIIFLGPDKLPTALANVAKMFKSVKKGVDEVKQTIDSEIEVNELKKDLNQISSNLDTKNIKNKLDDIIEKG